MRHAAALAVVTLALAACGRSDDAPPPPPCPGVFLLGDAGELSRLTSGGEIDYSVRVSRRAVSCEYDSGRVDVELEIGFTVEREAAGPERPVAFEYFVALPALAGRAGGKRVFPVAGQFEADAKRMSYVDEVTISFAAERPGPQTDIVVGFQLSAAELAYNRKRRRR